MTDLWKQYAGDFNAMRDDEIEGECDRCREEINELESWLEAVASWEAAGRPREESSVLQTRPEISKDNSCRANPEH